jgi:hypothetical protein
MQGTRRRGCSEHAPSPHRSVSVRLIFPSIRSRYVGVTRPSIETFRFRDNTLSYLSALTPEVRKCRFRPQNQSSAGLDLPFDFSLRKKKEDSSPFLTLSQVSLCRGISIHTLVKTHTDLPLKRSVANALFSHDRRARPHFGPRAPCMNEPRIDPGGLGRLFPVRFFGLTPKDPLSNCQSQSRRSGRIVHRMYSNVLYNTSCWRGDHLSLCPLLLLPVCLWVLSAVLGIH